MRLGQLLQAEKTFGIAQVTVALCNGIVSFIWLTIIQAQYPALFAFIAFLFAQRAAQF